MLEPADYRYRRRGDDLGLAEDNSTPPHEGTLPGVTNDYRIAKPAAEPDDAVPSGNSQFRIGDTDVRISGSIIFDVGAGAIKAPRR